MKEKITVVWLCHFSNPKVRSNLTLSSGFIEKHLRKILNKELKPPCDFASWVSMWIEGFEMIEGIDLHIVSPHQRMKKKVEEFAVRGIQYHFFKPQGYSYIARAKKKIFPNRNPVYHINRKRIKNLIGKIKPDLVNLIGAENPYYSIGALDVKNIPLLITLQTVYSDPDVENSKEFNNIYLSYSQKRKNLELQIFKSTNYFGTGGLKYHDLVKAYNSNAYVFQVNFPSRIPDVENSHEKQFDFVYFGKIVSHKGAEDVVRALAIVKDEKEDVTLNMAGSCNPEYKTHLLKIIKYLGLEDNVCFTDYFPLQKDFFTQLTKSTVVVLPVKYDIIPSTVREAITLKLPIVTNITSGTPWLNKDSEAVILTEVGNIEMLAKNMKKVLFDEQLQQTLVDNAMKLYEKEFSPNKIVLGLVNDYYAIVNHYKNNVPIPDGQLFNRKEFTDFI